MRIWRMSGQRRSTRAAATQGLASSRSRICAGSMRSMGSPRATPRLSRRSSSGASRRPTMNTSSTARPAATLTAIASRSSHAAPCAAAPVFQTATPTTSAATAASRPKASGVRGRGMRQRRAGCARALRFRRSGAGPEPPARAKSHRIRRGIARPPPSRPQGRGRESLLAPRRPEPATRASSPAGC